MNLNFFCSVPQRVPLRKSLLVWACQLWCMLDLSPGSWFYIMEQSLAYIHVQKCGGRGFLLNSLLIPWLTEVCRTFSWECLFISAGCFPSPFLPLFILYFGVILIFFLFSTSDFTNSLTDVKTDIENWSPKVQWLLLIHGFGTHRYKPTQVWNPCQEGPQRITGCDQRCLPDVFSCVRRLCMRDLLIHHKASGRPLKGTSSFSCVPGMHFQSHLEVFCGILADFVVITGAGNTSPMDIEVPLYFFLSVLDSCQSGDYRF